MNRKKYAVILAAGSGSRMGFKIPKQFLQINGKPILRHTIEKFLSLSFPVEIIVVLSSDFKEEWKEYCRKNDFLSRYVLPSGGLTRFHSVQNALKYVPDGVSVAIHDGVRPFVTTEFLERLFSESEKEAAVVPAIRPSDSVREEGTNSSFPLDRDKIYLIQTPQVYHSEILKKSYEQPYSVKFTDDASVVEASGYSIKITEGLRYNIKITTPEDLETAKVLLG